MLLFLCFEFIVTMKNPRLVFSAILKILTVLGLVILLLVLTSSLFVHQDKEQVVKRDLLTIDLNGMRDNDIRKIHWNGKEVTIFQRKQRPSLYHTKYLAKIPHHSLNSGLRSISNKYFVYINQGDSGNCPLFKETDGFKDTCTGTRFDATGREKGKGLQGYRLEIPPHYFQGDTLFVGAWVPINL